MHLHQIRALVYTPTDASINAATTVDPILDLLNTFMEDNAVVCVHKTIHIPDPYSVILLVRDMMPVEFCSRLQGYIGDMGAEVGCGLLIGWLRVVERNPPPPGHL